MSKWILFETRKPKHFEDILLFKMSYDENLEPGYYIGYLGYHKKNERILINDGNYSIKDFMAWQRLQNPRK